MGEKVYNPRCRSRDACRPASLHFKLNRFLVALPSVLMLALTVLLSGNLSAQSVCPGPGTFSSMTFNPADPASNVNHAISNITMTPVLAGGYQYLFQLNGTGAWLSGSSINNVPVGPHCITSAVFASTNVFCNGVLYTAGMEIPNTRSSACLYFGTGAPQPILASNIEGNRDCTGEITPTPAPNRTCFTYEYSVDGGAWTSTLPIPVSAGCHTLANRVSCSSGVSFGAPIPTTGSATTDFSIFDDLTMIDVDDITIVKTCSSGSDGAITSITGLPTAAAGLMYEYSVDGGTWGTTFPTNLTPGCHTIAIRQSADCPNGSGDGDADVMCIKEVNFVIFPTAPTITAPSNSCAAMFTLPTVTPVGGFNVEYSIDGGMTWEASPSTTTPGCYSVQARYVSSGDCGVDPPLNVVPSGSSSSDCGAGSNVVNAIIFPASPVLTAPDNTCAVAFTLPTVTPVTNFNVEYSIDGGAWSAAPTVPSTPGCYSVKARYVYPGVCGGLPRPGEGAEVGSIVGPAPCDESAAVNVVIFPSAPVLTAPTNTCNAALTLPTVTAVTGFTVQYSVDGGTYSASATAPSTAGCHTFKARYVLTAACGSIAANATAPMACEESNEVSAVVFPAAPSITDPADACNAMFTLPMVTPVTGFDVVYRIDGGMWEANPSTTTAGCYTIEAAYALAADCGTTTAGTVSTDASCGASNSESVVIFPAKPVLTATANVCEGTAFTLPTVTPVTGFTVEYDINASGTWSAMPTIPTTAGCHEVKARYVLTAACGGTAAGTAGTGDCGESDAVNITTFPTAPVLTAPSDVCFGSPVAEPTVTPVTDFSVEYSVDGGMTWDDWATVAPTTVGCHSIKARYVLTADCGSTTAGTAGVTGCVESNEVNVLIFPAAPVLTAPGNTCAAMFTLPTVTETYTDFDLEYSIDNGMTWSASPSTTTPGCYDVKARFVYTGTCGMPFIPRGRNGAEVGGTAGPAPCDESAAVNVVIFPSAPVLTAPTNTCNVALTLPTVTAVTGFTVEYSVDGGTYSASATAPSTAGCHTFKARYVLAAACGNNAIGATAPTACLESNEVSAVVFPAAPSITDPADACNAMFTLPTVTPVTGFDVVYRIDGGTWEANPSTTTAGCYTIEAAYALAADCGTTTAGTVSTDASCGASSSESVVIFPAKPVLTATANVCEGTAFTLPTVTPVTGFTVEYDINASGTWSAMPTIPTTAGCHEVKARYVLTAACGGTAAGTAGTGDCGESDAVNITTFPTAPVLTAPSDVCFGSPVAEPTVTPVTDFSVEYSVDGGMTWDDWATVAPTTVGCHSIKARYVLTADCGSTTAGTAGVTGCEESNEVNVLIYPAAPVLTAPDNTCAAMFTLPTVTETYTDFDLEYSIDNGMTWSASPSTTTPGCYDVKARFVYTGTCGMSTPAGPAPCDASAAVNVIIFPDISMENITTVTKSATCGTTNITAVNWATATPTATDFELRYDIDGGTAFTSTDGLFTNLAPGCHTITAKWATTAACGSIAAGAVAPSGCEETHDFIVWVDMSGNWPTVTLSDTCGAGVKITSVNYLPTAPSIPAGQELVYSGESNGVAFTDLTLDALKMVDFSYNAAATQPGCHTIRAKARATTACKDADDMTAAADGAEMGAVAANTCRTTGRGFITFPTAPTLTANPVCEGGTLTVTPGSAPPTDYEWRYLLVDYTSGTPTPVGSWTSNTTFTPADAGCYKVFVTPVRVTTGCNGINIPACGAIYPSNVQRPLDMQNSCNPDGADISAACFDSVDVVVLTQSPMAIQPNNITVCLDETGYIDLAHVQQTVPACVADVANLSYIITSSDETVVTSVPAPGLMSGDDNNPELFYTGVNGNSYPNVVTVGVQAVLSVPGAMVSCVGPEVFFTITVQPNFTTTTGWNVDPSTAVQCEGNDGWTIYTEAGPGPSIVKNDADSPPGGSEPGCTYELYYGTSLSPLGLPVGNALVQSILGDGNPIEFQKVYIPGTYQVWQRCGGCAELAYTVNLSITGAPELTNLQLEACPDAPGGNTATFTGITYPTPAPTTPPSTLTILGYYGTYTGAADGAAGDLLSATGGFDHVASDDEIYVRIGQDVDGIPGDDCFHVGVIELRVVNRPVVLLTADTETCVDQTVRISSNVHSGSGTYQYLWSDGSTTDYIDVTSSVVGPVTYTVTVTDPNTGVNGSNGPSCTTEASITVNYAAPALTCPADVTFSADPGTCSAYVNLQPATLNSDCANGVTIAYYATGATTVNSVAAPGTLGSVMAVPFGSGVTNVTAVAVGTPSTTCTYTVTVLDTEAPIAKCKSIVVALDATGQVTVNSNQLDGGSSDNCISAVGVGFYGFENYFATGNWVFSSTGDGSLDVSNAPSSIALTGNDNSVSGNTQICITAPEDMSVIFNWSYTTVEDPLYDSFGYSIDGVFTQLSDASSQAQVGTAVVPLTAGQSFCYVVNSMDGLFGPAVTVASQFSYNVSFDCSNLGNNDVTLTVTDGSGNESSCIANVVVQDVTAPTLSCPSPVVANVDPSTGCTWTSGSLAPVTATDNCTLPAGALTYEVMNPAQALTNGAGDINALVFEKGTSVVEYSLVDGSGNVSTCAFNVTVIDNVAPAFANCPANITVSIDAAGTTVSPAGAAGGYVVTDPISGAGCAVNISYTAPTASDNCTMYTTSLAQGMGAAEQTYAAGTHTERYVVQDMSGNTAECAFTITVVDAQAPVLTCSADVTVGTNASCVASVPVTASYTDNCGAVSIQHSFLAGAAAPSQLPSTAAAINGFASGPFYPGVNGVAGTTIVVYVATDVAGNTSTCSASVTVMDDDNPAIACPNNVTVSADNGCVGNLSSAYAAAATDNCGAAALVTTYQLSGATTASGIGGVPTTQAFNLGATFVTYTSTDAMGNSAQCTAEVRVLDVTAPTLVCPSSLTQNVDPVTGCTWTSGSLAPVTATDNCTLPSGALTNSMLTPSQVVSSGVGALSGVVFEKGTSVIEYTMVDGSGNVSTCAFNVTVVDNVAPAFANCPANITVSIDAAGTTVSPAGAAGGYVVTDPISGAGCAVNISYTAPTASDNCTMYTTSLAQGMGAAEQTYVAGTHTERYVVQDMSGNTAECAFTITVVDAQAPVLTCSADVTVGTNASCVASVPVTASYTDNCGAVSIQHSFLAGAAAPSQLPSTAAAISGFASGPFYPGVNGVAGTTIVVYVATDVAGNTSTCSASVTVMDDDNPAIACPNNVTVSADNGCVGNLSSAYAAAATDNCGAAALVTTYQLSGATTASGTGSVPTTQGFNLGETAVTFTVADAAGNTALCTSIVTVVDMTAPTFTCPAPVTVNADGNCVGTYTPSAPANQADNCSTSGLTWSVSNSGSVMPLGDTYFVYTVMDEAGNVATCSQKVTVVDVTAPTVVCPPSVTLGTDQSTVCSAYKALAPVAFDNCSTFSVATSYAAGTPAPAVLPTSNLGGNFSVGETIVTFTISDVAGNTASCSLSVTVLDDDSPVIACPNDVTLSADASCTAALATPLSATVTDNCGATTTWSMSGATIAAGTGSVATTQVFNLGVTFVTFTAVDAAGNSVICTSTVTVEDVTAPTFTCPAPVVVDNCNAVVPDLVAGITDAADNCSSVSLSQNPTPGLEFGIFSGNSITVTITATDASGNTATCDVLVTVDDDDAPTFLNCPTTTLVFANDPDQCSATVNWLAPVAVDDCLPLTVLTNGAPQPGTIVQTAGPAPGSTLPITCPPTPVTVTYVATDGNGNQSSCSFQVQAMDTQKPSFNTGVLMPANVTVECNAIPSNCVPTSNGQCEPLNASHVNDNCPGNLTVTFNEVSTKNANPAVCGHYDYTITRTWTVTDCAGNALQHTQVIDVNDTSKPTAVCQNITVTLDDFGTVSITPKQLDGGSTDNCAANANLSFAASQTTFTCADFAASPVSVTLTVTDPCGNTSTCTALVTVLQGNSDCTPEYDVTGSDPCVCLDNATTTENGQFGEFIQIHAIAGQTWTITANNGLYTNNSPAPPATPVLIANGTVLTVGNVDGVDNDGDGSVDELDERVYYSLRGRHVDALGYTASFSNGTDVFAIGNKCYYPNPYFTNLNDPFCLSTPVFTIEMGEYSNAAGTVENVMVNGQATTVFNAAQLGEGYHTVMATYNAGAPGTNVTINGVPVTPNAPYDPGCKQKITKVVQVIGTPTSVVCNDTLYVSLDADCSHTISPDDVLEGNYGCYDDYTVRLDKTLPMGNGPWLPATVNASDIGKFYAYQLTHALSGNLCNGVVKIEDKLAPALTCPADITIACSESTAIANTGNVVITDCSSTSTQITESVVDNGACGSPRQVITRTFIVTDAWGNQSVCSHTITIEAFDLANVVMPANVTVNCESVSQNPNATAPAATGRPSINGASIGNGTCSATFGYSDQILAGCAGTYEILRTWTVKNTCLPLSASNPIEYVQVILVQDASGPQFACPGNVTVSTDANNCCATAALPDMIISEGCSGITELEARITGVDPSTGNITTFTVNGSLADFPGNNYWNPDTLAVFPYTQCMAVGTYTVAYTAKDGCENTSSCVFEMTIEDQTPPAAVCDEWTQVAVGNDGTAQVDALTFDDGSLDNCGPVFFKVRRMDSNDCQIDTLFHDQVRFCCSDVNDTIMVVLRVYDAAQAAGSITMDGHVGNYNDCMVQVLVEDKIKPICTAPANVTVSCEAFDPSLWAYDTATALDNCSSPTITGTVAYNQFDTLCNKGTITRRWTAVDAGGNTASCSQRIVVTYNQNYYVKFPDDRLITTCDGTGNYGQPEFYGAQDCELMSVSYTDEFFTVIPDACFKIERTWTVLNWCQYNPNGACIVVPNPEPNAIVNNAQNRLGVTVSAPGTSVPGWEPTVRALTPGATPTNFSGFWNKEANCYKYKQIIKVIDTQDPELVTPSAPEYCDYSENSPEMWNAMYWYDNTINSHDLCEGDANIELTATDACSGANIRFKYLLFLDLDGNGSMETVVNSNNSPGYPFPVYNNVQFDNANTPNYLGGESRAFDFRPVPANQKWGFGVQTDAPSGNNRTARVRWVNQAGQNTVPQLPYGTHKIKWFVEDGCGNETVVDQEFIVKDCKKPTVVCLNGLSVNLMNINGGMVSLFASDFLQYTEDNCTPSNQLTIAVRRSGTGTGFPTNADGTPQTEVQFTCADLGTQLVELWSIDKAGNADYCETYVLVQDNAGICSPNGMATIAGALETELTQGVEDATIELNGTSNGTPVLSEVFSNVSGSYLFSNALPIAANATVTPIHDVDPLNGVNTWDLVLISRHILGLEPLSSPYKLIAADANKSGTVTTFDIVELRKLILGTYTALPNNNSWRFVDAGQQFTNNDNPFADVIRENLQIANIQQHLMNGDFVGVKVGDVDQTAVPNTLTSSDDRTAGTLLFDVADRKVAAGEEFVVNFKAAQQVAAYQFTLNFRNMEVMEVVPGAKQSLENFGIFQSAITTSADATPGEFAVRFRATANGTLSQLLSVSSQITKAVAFEANNKLDVAIRFNGANTTISSVGFELYQNTPNPWVSKTQIGFHLPEAGEARLTIYDAMGRILYTAKGQYAKGYNVFSVDRKLVDGVGNLYYKVETTNDAAVKPMVVTN